MDVAKLIAERQGIRLDIGCGANAQPGFLGMDIQDLPGVDIVHSWDDYPWPLPDECCLTIMASHVVEHVNPANMGFIKWMNECWRISKPDGQLALVLPYANSYGFWQDPTHCNGCNETTWAYFDPNHPSGLYRFYQPKPWALKFISWDTAINMEVILHKIAEVPSAGNE